MARKGVMPTPAAIRATRPVDWAWWVKAPYGPFDPDPCARLEPGDGSAVVAQGFDRHPHQGRAGESGEGVRVRLPPQVPGQEAPLEELAAGDGQTVQAAAPADDRVDARGFLADPSIRNWWRRLRAIGSPKR